MLYAKKVSRSISRRSFTIPPGLLSDIFFFWFRADASSLRGILCNSRQNCSIKILENWKKISSCKFWPSTKRLRLRTEKEKEKHCEKILKTSLFISRSLNYSSCRRILAMIRFHLTFNIMVQERSASQRCPASISQLQCHGSASDFFTEIPHPSPQCPDQVQCPSSTTDYNSKISHPGLWNCIFPFLTRCYCWFSVSRHSK